MEDAQAYRLGIYNITTLQYTHTRPLKQQCRMPSLKPLLCKYKLLE